MATFLRPSPKAVVGRDGLLLVVRNRSQQDPAGEWSLLPGGGITVAPGGLLWIREYLPAHHEFTHLGQPGHAIGSVFEADVVGQPAARHRGEPPSDRIGMGRPGPPGGSAPRSTGIDRTDTRLRRECRLRPGVPRGRELMVLGGLAFWALRVSVDGRFLR